MYFKKNKLNAVFLFILGLSGLHAQETTTASGANASGTGGSASYSVGQMLYTTNSSGSETIAQGVQQPYEISIITGVEETKGISLSCVVYPNPASDFLTLKVENYTSENLSYQFSDMNGKLLENKKLSGNVTNIAISDVVPSTYFLKVSQNNKVIKTFKIIKN